MENTPKSSMPLPSSHVIWGGGLLPQVEHLNTIVSSVLWLPILNSSNRGLEGAAVNKKRNNNNNFKRALLDWVKEGPSTHIICWSTIDPPDALGSHTSKAQRQQPFSAIVL